MSYVGTFSHSTPGLRLIDRSAEGFLEIVYDQCFDIPKTGIYDCGPYTLTITKDGAPFQTITRPNHFYEASWWIDIEPVTIADIKRGPAELIADGCVPPFGDPGLKVDFPKPGTVTIGGPMTLATGVTGYEPQTGGRGGIGIVRDNTAEFLCTGDARNMLVVAKSVPTLPIWNYDNGKLIDMIAKPKTTHYYSPAQGGYPIWLGPFPTNPSDIRPMLDPMPPINPSTPQTAHMEDHCGVVTLATGAPRYLRALQQRVNRGFNADNAGASQYGAASIFSNEVRGIAWQARQLFYCYKATLYVEKLGKLPADCFPSSHWKQIIDNQAAQFAKYIEPNIYYKNFGVLGGFRIAFWQSDMVNQAFGLYAQEWPAVWGPIYIKLLRNLAARVNADGKKQWPVACPTWYWGDLGPSEGQAYSGYPELWEKWSALQTAGDPTAQFLSASEVVKLKADPTNGGVYIQPSEYQSWLYGALAFAVYLDRGKLAGAVSAAYPNLENAFAQQHAMMKAWENSGNPGARLIPQCSISVTPKPPVVVPDPDPTPDPVPTPTEYPKTVHGLYLRAQEVLKRV